MSSEVRPEKSAEEIRGRIPTGLPGGFFLYEAWGEEKILFADENVIALFGCRTLEEFREYTGNTFGGMVHPEDLHKIQNEIISQTMFGERRHDYVRYRIVTKQGRMRYIEDFGHLLHGQNGQSFFYVFIVDVDRDEYLNRSRNSYAEAQVLSMNQETDSLTGLFNMSSFYQKAHSRMMSQERHRLEAAFIHFDIPNFKLFNERFGFRIGDELLCQVAYTIREVFSDGVASRFSDDHFVAFTMADSREAIIRGVEEVQNRIMKAEDANKRVRMKTGVYFLDDKISEVGLACDHARLACNSIRGRYDVSICVYDEALREKLRKQQYVVDHVDEAVEKEYIKVYYQPVIRVSSGKICGYEALVRWIDPVMGFLSPGDFIETLEQFHLIHVVDNFVVRKVAEDYQRLKAKGEDLVPVSINLSRLDFELCNMVEYIEGIREEYDMPRHMLDLEITESALTDNTNLVKDVTERFHERGYHIWIDDFGSGYSSLNVLAEYTFDVLKLDMVFLRSFDRNPRTRTLMSYIIGGALGMNVEPLAEGVETEEHYNFLKQTGCIRAQGYYFAKPMPMDESRVFTRNKGMTWEKN